MTSIAIAFERFGSAGCPRRGVTPGTLGSSTGASSPGMEGAADGPGGSRHSELRDRGWESNLKSVACPTPSRRADAA